MIGITTARIKAEMKAMSYWLDYSHKREWKDWINKLSSVQRDIYFDPEYVVLYANDHTSAECYIYRSDHKIFIYPFLKQSIEQAAGFFDITTPYGYGGPVSNTDDQNFLSEAIKCFNQEACRRNIIAEVIKFHPLLNNQEAIKSVYKGRILWACPTVYVDTTVDEKYQWKEVYSRVNRQEINKAKRAGIRADFVRSEDAWRVFETLYAKNMAYLKTDDFYIFPPTYYEQIRRKLKDNYMLVSCSLDKEIISVLLVLLGFRFVHCHLIGTNPEYVGKDVNKLLYHELFLWCKLNGFKKYHIGGGRTNSEDDSLFRFKKNFSNNIGSLYVGENVLNAGIYDQLCKKWLERNPQVSPSRRLLLYRI